MRLVVIGRQGRLARSLQERAAGFADINLVLSGRPEIDSESLNQLRSAIHSLSPDAVLTAAAHTAVGQAEDEPERAWACNADAPAVLAQVTAELGVPMIHISTDYVFAGGKPGAYRRAVLMTPLALWAIEAGRRTAGPVEQSRRVHRADFLAVQSFRSKLREDHAGACRDAAGSCGRFGSGWEPDMRARSCSRLADHGVAMGIRRDARSGGDLSLG